MGRISAAQVATSGGSGIAMKRRTPRRYCGRLEGGGSNLVADQKSQEGDREHDRERRECRDARRLAALDTGKCCDDQVSHRYGLQAFGVPNVADERLLSRCRCGRGAFALLTLLAATLFSGRCAGWRLIRS